MSRWLFKFERGLAWERGRRWAIAILAGYLVLYWVDRAIFHWSYVGAGMDKDAAQGAREAFEGRLWAQMLRLTGYLPVWLAVGAVLAVSRRAMDGLRIVAAAALGGGLAEVLKPLVGQVRPRFTDGVHMFRHATDFADSEISYGMASSHVGVAFGAACTLVFLYGRAGWAAVVLAAGCGVERVMAGSHFATDVYVAALLGYASARLVRPGGWTGQGPMLP